MTDKMDMALEDIIKSTKGSDGGRGGRGPRGGRGGAGGRGRGSSRGGPDARFPIGSGSRSGMTSGKWSHDMYQSGGAGRGRNPPPLMAVNTAGPIKLTISNLDYGVTDSDIRELFREFGDMRTAAVHYDRSGCSLGSGQVVFGRYGDASKAMKQYNGVHLDGRPMKITIEGGESQMGGSRTGGSFGGSGRPMVKRLQGSSRPAARGSPRGARGGRGGRGGKSNDAKPKSAEELDAELDSYLSSATKSKKEDITA